MPSTSSARRVAVLSDVHGNAVALEAVLAELSKHLPELVVFGGDLTWGPLPEETLALVDRLAVPAVFVRGNAERALLEPADDPTERERWLLGRHSAEALAFLGGFAERVSVHIDRLGPVCLCHGSPRSDEELVTPGTPEARIRAMTAEVSERVLVTAHTHIQFDRLVAGIRSISAGSIGMPYEDEPGAYWALLGPDVELQRTEYSVDRAVERYRESGDPLAEQMVEVLVNPLSICSRPQLAAALAGRLSGTAAPWGWAGKRLGVGSGGVPDATPALREHDRVMSRLRRFCSRVRSGGIQVVSAHSRSTGRGRSYSGLETQSVERGIREDLRRRCKEENNMHEYWIGTFAGAYFMVTHTRIGSFADTE